MKKWKKFIAMGLAVSMIVPSCIPQTLWASEFSAGSVESAADVFEVSTRLSGFHVEYIRMKPMSMWITCALL